MEYIFNVKAQFEQKKEYNIEAQFEAIKKNIEGQVIHVQAKIDPNSLSLAKIQEQLKNEKLTLNIGNVTFKDTGLDNIKTEIQQVASATENVTQQTQQAKQAVQQLVSEYKKLSIEDVNKEFSSNGKLSTSLGISQESLDTQKTIDAMRELKQQYESVWGKGMVDITARTETSTHAINGFTIAVKNAENQIYKFRYSANQNKDTGLWSFDYSGSTFADSAIQKTKEQTKELQNQEKELRKINEAYQNIAASTHDKTKPMLGVDVNDGSIAKNDLFGSQSKTLQTQIENYITLYNNLKKNIADYQNTIKSGKPISQEQINTLQTQSAEFKRLAESIRSAQYADTQMSSKSVTNQKAIVSEELKAFEADVKNSNLATQEFVQRISDVNTALQTAGDRNSFRTAYEDLRKLEAEFKSMQQISQSNAAKESFNVDYSKASKSLDEVIKKIQELGSNESNLTFRTTDLLEAFSNISDKYSLQTFNKMLTQATKEVNAQTQAVENQEKEYQRLTDIVNKAYANATNTSTNSNAIQNVENIKLLRTQYDTVIEALNRLKNSTTDTFEENKKTAQQAIQGFQDYSKVLQNSEQSIKATDEAIKKLEQNTQKGFFANNVNDSNVAKLKQDIDGLRNTYTQLQSQFQAQGSTTQVTQGFATLDERIKSVSQTAVNLQQNLRQVNTELSLTGQKSNLNNRIETWLKNNTKASGTTVQALKQLQAQIQSADKVSLRNLTQRFKDITKNAELAGETGKSVFDSFNEKIGKFTSWFGVSQSIMAITNEVKQAIVTLKEVDTILTEISKTSERSAESLAKLGESAFDTASKYGVAVQSYLRGVQEMARAGYETMGEGQSEKMAELALLVQSAGDVTDSVARDYLIATDAAYQFGGSLEKLQSVADSQNKISNNMAVSMNDMASATKEAASIANQYGITIEELSSLIAIATARTRLSGSEIGNSLKSIFVSLSDTTNKQVVKAFNAVEISMYKFVDGSKRLKTPIELLGELSEKFKELPQGDDRRSIILNDIFGRYRANVGAAILQDWDSMQTAMSYYDQGAGSMLEESAKSVQTLAAQLTNLKTAGQELVSKFFNADDWSGIIKVIVTITQSITDLVAKLGAIPTILGTIAGIGLFKNRGVLVEFGKTVAEFNAMFPKKGNVFGTFSSDAQVAANMVKNLSVNQQAAVLSTRNLTNAQIAEVLAMNNATDAEISRALATVGLTSAVKANTYEEMENAVVLAAGNTETAKAIIQELALTAATDGQILGLENLNRELVIQTATQKGLNAVQAEGVATTLGFGVAANTAKGFLLGFGTVLKTLLIQLKVIAPELLILSAAVAGFVAIKKVIDSSSASLEKQIEQSKKRKEQYEEEIATVKKNVDEYSKSVKTLKEYSDEYTKLSNQVVLSSDDKEKLIDIQHDLIDTYGSEAKGIDLVNGKYEENIELITKLTQKEKERARQNAQAAYYDAKRNNQNIADNGGAVIFDQYDYNSSKANDPVYLKAMLYGELQAGLFNRAKFGDERFVTYNSELNNKQVIEAIDKMLDLMDGEFDRAEKASESWNQIYTALVAKRTELENKQKEENERLNKLAELTIQSYIKNGVDMDSVTEETYQSWHDGMIAQYAKDDPDLRKAIEDKLASMYTWLGANPTKDIVPFNFSDFYKENGLEDIIKLLGKVQTAYKNIESDPNGFNLDDEVLEEFPELVNYLDDADKLKEKLQELVNVKIEPLITSLKEMQENLPKDSDDYKAISNTISWLEKQADITTKVKEKTTKTSDLYKEQKKQIHENIQALNREISAIEKQVDALEKKKESQKEYIKLLEKEKDRLEDLIDDYETAADVVKDFLDSQLDDLEKKKDSIEDYYEEQTKAAEEYYDKQIELASEQAKAIDTKSTIYDSQIDNIESQIKAIQDEADEQDKLNDLKEKELALEKAKSQMVRVYDKTKGWVK